MTATYVSEIYPSVQGEGPYTGERQIFLRLAGCPLRCDYCDTPGSLTAKGHPLRSANDILSELLRVRRDKKISTVSVTGGEPLAHAAFLKTLLPRLKKNKFRVYLETAGAHPAALRQIIRFCDVVSMDVKLPSATRKTLWTEHKKFLAVGGSKIFVKIVIAKNSPLKELETAVAMLNARAHPPRRRIGFAPQSCAQA
jgi:organic radical activating enzyme